MHVTGCHIFSNNFDRLLFELHSFTLAACSYALLYLQSDDTVLDASYVVTERILSTLVSTVRLHSS